MLIDPYQGKGISGGNKGFPASMLIPYFFKIPKLQAPLLLTWKLFKFC